ncbi:hypothetical protein RclHR1_15410003 [Rhizophagus clarus]|uniref:Transmembrane protein n=1 Tax=Rhizophagus clarus TaxID=94130 RepID=A0A2Z6R7U0_9GLOM|nr:hypothetical protein RclHR1_15410003 [Rhizophagus clarus]
MTTNTITNVETLSAKQNNNTSKLNNSTSNTSLNFSKNIVQETKKDLKRKAAIQATAGIFICLFVINFFFLNEKKKYFIRGPYYDPTTRMYHVSHNSKRYFAGYTEQDAEAEDAAASTSQPSSQPKVNNNNQNNQFKPIASIHNSEIITKDIVQVGGGHMPARVSHNGRRPGRPRKTDHF